MTQRDKYSLNLTGFGITKFSVAVFFYFITINVCKLRHNILYIFFFCINEGLKLKRTGRAGTYPIPIFFSKRK